MKHFRNFSILTQHRPAVFPLNRNQVRSAAYRTIITKQVSIPTTLWCADQSTLRYTQVLQRQFTFPRTCDFICPVNYNGTHATSWPGDVEEIVFTSHLV